MPDLLPHAQTRFAAKIARIRAGGYRPGDFMLADAKDADLSGGILTTGRRLDAQGRVTGNRTRAEFLDQMRGLIAQDVIDILLASAGNIETLAETGAFAGSAVMPAFRANEATDVWGNLRGGTYRTTPSRPHRGRRTLAEQLAVIAVEHLVGAQRARLAVGVECQFGAADRRVCFGRGLDTAVPPDRRRCCPSREQTGVGGAAAARCHRGKGAW